MVDRTTLPQIAAGETITAGQRFTVLGSGFNSWPNEIVLSFNEENINTADYGGIFLMKLVGKTNNSLEFEVASTYAYDNDHTWNVFGTPIARPRTILDYE